MGEAYGDERGIDPSLEQMRSEGYALVDWLVEQRAREVDEPVGAYEPVATSLGRLAEPAPEAPHELAESLRRIEELVLPHALRPSHPRFHGYIPCPGSWLGALGTFAAASLNPFLGSALGGGAWVAMELQVLDWLAELVGWPPSEGILTSGGSMANLGALAAARSRVAGWRTGTVLLSEHSHASIDKAAQVLGFLPGQLRHLPTDDGHRLRGDVVADAIAEERAAGREVVAVCANAGTTNTGAVDHLDDIADACAEADVWLHVDGAYGGPAAATQEGRRLLAGMERADSLTLDPHKWLYAPIGCGCLLVRHPGVLAEAFATDGAYLKDLDRSEVNFFERGPELTRPARALPLWLALRTAGLDRIREEVATDLALAAEAEALLRDLPTVEVVGRSLSIVTFRLAAGPAEDDAARTRREDALVAHLLAEGDVVVTSTVVDGRNLLRLVVMSPRTTRTQLRRSVASLAAAIDEAAPPPA